MVAGGAPTPPETCAKKLKETWDGEGSLLLGPPTMVTFGGVRITNTSISLQQHSTAICVSNPGTLNPEMGRCQTNIQCSVI